MRLLEKCKGLIISLILFIVCIVVMFNLVGNLESKKVEIRESANLTRAYIGSGYYDKNDDDKFYMTREDYVESKMTPHYVFCGIDGLLIVLFGVITIVQYKKVSSFISKQAKLEEELEKEKLDKSINKDET